ncbi:MAG TPA: T9SS type A sorting domain-containing protein, partial [Saprospiraceae bacterium]|nr:T9SS type A sorting domain-containing protein [Saprospiraceae bacterium]
ALTDGEGGFLTGTYVVQPFGVGVKEPVTVLDFILAPNPTNGFTSLRFNTPLADDTRVALYDASGRLVRSWSAGAGSGALNLDVQDLPKGVYAVTVENAKGKTARKLIVQ